jgi:hypothetical protein
LGLNLFEVFISAWRLVALSSEMVNAIGVDVLVAGWANCSIHERQFSFRK